MTKNINFKGHQNQKFWALKFKFYPKKRHSEISVCKMFYVPPKLGARSPPMCLANNSF